MANQILKAPNLGVDKGETPVFLRGSQERNDILGGRPPRKQKMRSD